MKEWFVYGAQTMSMRGPDTQQAASGPNENGGEQLCGQSEEAVVSLNTVPLPSPMTIFLTRSELVPYVLELEKSLLVSKEHDYAKAPDRAAILQATTILDRKAETTNHNDEARTEAGCGSSGTASYDELLNCCGDLARLRSSLLRTDENVASRHLREVVSLQASLVREQQEQLYAKDRELASIRKDRDQLEARLERMERRLAVHQKRNTATTSTPEVNDSHTTPSTPSSLTVSRRLSRTESLVLSQRLPRSRSSSVEGSRNRLRPSSHAGTPVLSEEGGKKSARKRLRTEENSVTIDTPIKRIKKPLKLAEIRTELEYSGLGLLPMDVVPTCCSTNHTDSLGKNSDDGLNEGLSLKQLSSTEALSNNVLGHSTTIVVPSWKLNPLEPLVEPSNCDNPEDISDDSFLRRHKKYEEDEKRRKRWDLQRARTLLEHQELLKKYNKKSGAAETAAEKKKEKVVTFVSKLEDVEEIEVLPTVAVSAFGHPLPLLKKTDFELPWFDLDIRKARENVRTTRSKARASHTSAGSSDDS